MRKSSGIACALFVLSLAFYAGAVRAGPWAAPEHAGLRQDLQLLSDAGIVKIPLATWPLNWRDIQSNLTGVDHPDGLRPAVRAAWHRVRAEARRQLAPMRVELRLTAADKRRLLRFDMRNRAPEGSNGRVTLEGTSRHLSASLAGSYFTDPEDDHNARLDGSYITVNWFNWALTFGEQQRWWGPAHESSLILSNNARPVPALALQRIHTDAIDLPVLRWIGPWQFRAFAAGLGGDRYVDDPLLIGMRFDFKPIPRLEIGISRTMQFGGEGRPGSLHDFGNALIGRDTNTSDKSHDVSNQLAGFDFRLRIWRSIAAYVQFIGEDEGGLHKHGGGFAPIKFTHMGGIEGSHPIGDSGAYLSWFAEYADTAVGGIFTSTDFNTAYENSVYKSGYRYHGRSLGYTTDNDASLISLGGMLRDSAGRTWQLVARTGRLNRDGKRTRFPNKPRGNRIASQETSIISVDADVGLALSRMQALQLGLSYLHQHMHASNHDRDDVYAYARWTISFQP